MTIMIDRGAVLTAAIGGSASSPHSTRSRTPLLQPSSSYRSPMPDPQQVDIDQLPLRTHTPINELKQVEVEQEPGLLLKSFSRAWRASVSQSCYHTEEDSLPGLEDSDDDCTTISSCSSRGARSSRSLPRAHVSFAPDLVTEVRTRPRTKPQDVRVLFYSCEETQRFRQEYRLERMEATEDEPEETSSNHVTLNQIRNLEETNPSIGHRISRVVVMHEDTLETFIDKDMDYGLPQLLADNGQVSHASEAFFDNDRFWSGQITWY